MSATIVGLNALSMSTLMTSYPLWRNTSPTDPVPLNRSNKRGGGLGFGGMVLSGASGWVSGESEFELRLGVTLDWVLRAAVFAGAGSDSDELELWGSTSPSCSRFGVSGLRMYALMLAFLIAEVCLGWEFIPWIQMVHCASLNSSYFFMGMMTKLC